MVRDALVIEASTLPIEAVYGRGKADLIANVEKRVRDQVEPIGINIERVYWIGNLRLPDYAQATKLEGQALENVLGVADVICAIARLPGFDPTRTAEFGVTGISG